MIEGQLSFETTNWSRVLAAGGDSSKAHEALSALCWAYWPPLYAFIRRWGHGPEDAADLTQAFFAELLRRGALGAVDPSRGRFRTYLLAYCRNFLCKSRRRESTRGPAPFSIDALDAESRYRVEQSDALTPEQVFDRRWALSVLERALAALRDEYRRSDKMGLFRQLEPPLAGEPLPGDIAMVASRWG